MKTIVCLATLAFLAYVPFIVFTFYSVHTERHGNAATLSNGPAAWSSGRRDTENELKEMRQRMEYLENKVNAYLAFGEDPFQGMKSSASAPACHNASYLTEFYCNKHPEIDDCDMDHNICLDDLLPGKHAGAGAGCIVYDFGIRDDPSFGEALLDGPFHCAVFGFDPSPITKKWYKTSPLKDDPRYKLFPFGGGGVNGDLTLREYNWNQITILQYPEEVIDPNNCDETHCKFKTFPVQHEYPVPVRTLKSVMDELGHKRISVLKLDIEGSEYAFLEAMIEDLSCLAVDELSLEWHHHSFDNRYGVSSSPHINVLVSLLEKRCGLYQWWVYDADGGWPANNKMYLDMGITLRYNLVGFRRKKTKEHA